MFGVILSLGSAAVFGANFVVVRRGVLGASSIFAVLTSVFMGPLFFLVIALVSRDIFRLVDFTWRTYIFFAASGIVHFVLGRSCAYRSIQLVGATRTNIVTGLNTVVTITLAVTLLGETFSPLMALGTCLSLGGPTLMAVKEYAREAIPDGTNPGKNVVSRGTLYVGLLYGAGAAVFWGSSSIFIKLGLLHGGSSIAGSLVAYCAATIAMSTVLLGRANRQGFFHLDTKSFHWFLLSGLAVNTAQMLRYLALSYTSAIIMSLMSRTIPLWVLVLSFLFNREFESFSRWVLVGNALLVTGTVLVLI